MEEENKLAENEEFDTEEFEAEADIVVFVDENGKEYEFEVIDELTDEGTQYLAMLSTEDAEDNEADSDELIVAKVVNENGEETLVLLEDEGEFEKISKLFTERLSEFFDFVDDDCCCDSDDCEECSGCKE